MRNPSLWIGGGLAGVLSICGYLVAVFVSLLGGLIFLVRIPRRRAVSRDHRRS